MALSKKRQRELDDLTDTAADVWEDQKEVLDRANKVIRAASRRARDEVSSGRKSAATKGELWALGSLAWPG